MDEDYRNLVRERFLEFGKKYNWFNKPSLSDKIAELRQEVKPHGITHHILNKSKSDFLHIDDRGDEHDRNNSDCVVIDDDDDDVDYGRVCEDSIGNFSEVNQDCSTESHQDSFENNHITDSKVEAEEIDDDYGHTDSDDGDDDGNDDADGNTDSDSYANGDVKYTCVDIDGENDSPVIRPKRRNVHRNNFIEVISISDSPLHTDEVDHVEDSRSLGNSDYCSSPFIIEDHGICNSPVKAGEVSCVEKSHSSHKNNHSDKEDLCISDSALEAGEESYLEESCSYGKNDHENDSIKSRHICDDPMNASKLSHVEESNVEQSCSPKSDKHCNDSDDDIDTDDEYNDGGDGSHNVNEDDGYEDFMQEPPCSTPLLADSNEVDGSSESELLRELTSPKSRNDSPHSNDITEDLRISDSPVKSSEVSNNEESCHHMNSDEHCDEREDDVGHENIDSDFKFNDDEDDDMRKDVRCQGIEEESDHFTSLLSNSGERDGNHGESDRHSKFNDDDDVSEDVSYKGIEAESTRPESSSNDIEDFNRNESPLRVCKESTVEASCSHGNSEEHNEDEPSNIEVDCDNNFDVNEDIEQQSHHFANSSEKYIESESDSEINVIKCSTENIEDLNLNNSPVKGCDVNNAEESCSHDNSKEYDSDKDDSQYNEPSNIDVDCDNDDVNEDIEQQPQHFTEKDSDSESDSELNAFKCSVNNYCSSNAVEDASPGISDSPLKASLTARLFKKYNPEKSESDMDDFERFLQKIRTPKQSRLSGEEREREAGLNAFIVDDDEEDQEEDVFYDPGFTPGLEELSDDDKENDDSIEMLTPASSINTHFKTPSSTSSFTSFASAKSRLLSSNSSRPRSVLDSVITPYANEKDFKKSKDNLVRELFELYNRTVFNNQLPSDFQITWNPRMRSTAGFCYYSKKNNIRMARIELADKVIDSADRLRDTLIHEMCHAAAWMISGVKAGHGAVWKKWTLRAVSVHQDLPPISRCHSYTINAKYTYRCTNNSCANTFGRHSKSVNLEKSRCAYCHSRLELVPQLKKDGTPQSRTPSRFALFVKQNYRRIKSDNGTFSHQDVMKALSSEFGKLSTS